MAVVKGKRNQSDVEYFDYAYKVVEHITKFLLSDLGIKKTYRDLKVFAYKAHMEETDKEEFNHLVNKYDLELETDFPNWLMCYYRETLLTIMRDLINNISAAYTLYPNSVYEFNIKKQYISDSIANCFDLKHQLQLVIRIFPANMKKYIPFVKEIDKEIELLKQWRKNFTGISKKHCYNQDEIAKRDAIKRVNKIEAKNERKLQVNNNFLVEYMKAVYTQQVLMDNLYHTTFYYNQQNQYCSELPIAACTFYDQNGYYIGDSAHDFVTTN